MLHARQERNLDALFDIFDRNDDGKLEWSDYQSVIDGFAHELGMPAASEPHQLLTGAFAADWEHLRSVADADRDGAVSRAEFLTHHDRMFQTDEGYRVAVKAIAELMVGLCDRDHDGALDASDYDLLLRAFRLDLSRGPEAFAKIDRNGDRRITVDELLQAVHEFFRSDDAAAPGQWLFGGPH